MIKLSEYEKNEAKRKIKEETKQKELIQDEASFKKAETEDAKKPDNRNEVDYNALDYEDNEEHQSDDENVSRKQVPSLVQYPLPGSFKPIEGHKSENANEKINELPNAKRSEVLAMALGVQIKTGEDPPTGEIEISGYNKKNKKLDHQFEHVNMLEKSNEVNTRLLKMAGHSENNAGKDLNNEDPKQGERNKFKIEKPDGRYHDRFKNGRNRDVDRRRDFRRPEFRRPDFRRRYETDRYRKNSRYRSPRRSRSRDKRKSRSRERSRRSRSKDNKKPRNVSKSRSPEPKKRKTPEPREDNGKDSAKKSESDVEKFKRRAEQILLLKKKMELELLEMKKKKEEEEKQVI